jgi:phage tail sheath gpL-like
MPISFAQIPSNIKVPLYWVEVDPSMAGLPSLNLKALLVGTMNSDGTAVPDVPIAIGSVATAEAKFGIGSELTRMFTVFFKNNFANEVWAGPVAEPVAATAATGKITVATPPTEAGTIHLYIGGIYVPVNVGATDTVDEVATAIVDACVATTALAVEAVVNGTTAAEVDLTCSFKGINGNDITVMLDYYGQIGGEIEPTGLTLTLPATGFLTGGAGTPIFDNLISNMGEDEYEYVAMPYTDSTSLLAWENEYGFSDTGRWGWMRQHFGHVFSAKRGDYTSLISFGNTRNSGVISIMAFEQTTPTPMFEYTAAYTAKAQRALSNDPARPLQTLQFMGTLPAQLHMRFNFDEINSLANNGLAIQKCWPGSGMTQIAREQTTYQLNLYGQPDDAYELVTTLATLAALLRNQRHAITTKYPRHKLADDGTRFGPGQAIITPGIAKAELVAQYRNDEFNGLVENTATFKSFLLVERDPNNPNRLNVLYPPDLINQLRIFAVLAQFRLQYDRGIDTAIVGYTGLSGVAGAGGALAGP